MTTCRNDLNLTRWLVLSAAGIGEGVNLQGKRTCRQIEPQRRPRAEAAPERMDTVPDDSSSSETMQSRAANTEGSERVLLRHPFTLKHA
jgi:hypothetical protein